jgi:putative ABC transport system substrate-binding protein
MNRRDAIIALAVLPGLATAQPAKPRVIAALDDTGEAVRAGSWAAFRKRLQELGYADGKSFVLEQRWANGDQKRLGALAAELVARKPDVIVVSGTPAALAMKSATSTIPIIAGGASDPVKSGLVKSFARPEANLTGVFVVSTDLVGKWLELLREIAPKARSFAVLTDTENPASMLAFREFRDHAKTFGFAAQVLDGRSPGNVERSFETMIRERVDAFVVTPSAATLAQHKQIVEAAARLRIPALYGRREYVDAGGLMFYGADFNVLYARVADYVHRILRGAKISELPFEQVSTLKFVLNVRTARVLGLKIPDSMRARVDEALQ